MRSIRTVQQLRRYCSKEIAKTRDDKKELATPTRPTDALYEAESKNSGNFNIAVQAVREKQRKRNELFENPEFRENQLGYLPDQYTLLRGHDKDGNYERNFILRNPKVLPGFLMFASVVFGGATVYFGYWNESKKYKKDFQAREEGVAYVGTPRLGGPFELIDSKTGKKVTSESLKGKWLYIYFGFTNCPDICPEEMKKLSFVTDSLEPILGDMFQPVFITVDPKRDGKEAVTEYLQDYHPSILGLTGSTAAVENATRQYRVFHSVPDIETFTESDYLVDHSIITYLMDPRGVFCDYTTKEYSTREAFNKIKASIYAWEKEQIAKGMTDVTITSNPALQALRVSGS
eukprot:TRINITY_DN3033_c1_g2_i1.p1 TRINITY_DN3033_c1_g2~~TRINITY_DN3033_c1_g2_i1.p1  ORF type:complete len:346 (+),score=52.17 TRINITY_DN3033_c1_g2_i1:69-1106(+)